MNQCEENTSTVNEEKQIDVDDVYGCCYCDKQTRANCRLIKQQHGQLPCEDDGK